MARLFDDAASQYLESASAPVVSTPLTLAAWVRRDANVQATVLSIMTSFTGSNGFRLEINGARSVRAIALGFGTGVAATVATAAENVWHHVAAVFESTTSRHVYLNGGNKVTNTTSGGPGVTPDVTAIGRIGGDTPGTYWTGDIALPAIWKVALSDTEVAALARGLDPRYVRPESLVGGWELWGLNAPEPDFTGFGRHMIVSGPIASPEPPGIVPFSVRSPLLPLIV